MQATDIQRTQSETLYKEVPPRVDYALTPLGRSLADKIVPLCTWGTENMAEMVNMLAERDRLLLPDTQEPLRTT